MKKLLTMMAAILVITILAPSAQACTANTAIDKARNSRDGDSYETARDVAEEELDKTGMSSETMNTEFDSAGYSAIGTPLEAATGSLLIDKYGNNSTGTTDNSMTQQHWRDFLNNSSSNGSINHSGVTTVKDHMLWHANDMATGMETGGNGGNTGGGGTQPSLFDHAG